MHPVDRRAARAATAGPAVHPDASANRDLLARIEKTIDLAYVVIQVALEERQGVAHPHEPHEGVAEDQAVPDLVGEVVEELPPPVADLLPLREHGGRVGLLGDVRRDRGGPEAEG